MPPVSGCPNIGHPYPEVTGAFCRVPSTSFSQAPWYSLPVHLCRFGVRFAMTMLRSFSWQCGINRFVRQSLSSSALAVEAPDLPRASGYRLKPGHPSPGRPILLRPSITRHRKYRNMNRFSFDYAFRPRLRCRLTLGGLPWPRKPWTFGGGVSHSPYRYLC